jgi:hypothetical protein
LGVDKPRIKLISNSVANNLSIPPNTALQSTNEILGVGAATGGFLRLSAENSSKSSIDLVGTNTSSNSVYNNSIRFVTGGTGRMIVNGSGNLGIGTPPWAMALELLGAAKVSTILSAQNGLILGDNSKTTMDNGNDGETGCSLNIFNTTGNAKPTVQFVCKRQ